MLSPFARRSAAEPGTEKSTCSTALSVEPPDARSGGTSPESAPQLRNQIIYLNVGGRRFATLRSTLAQQSTFFCRLLESRVPHDVDERGAIFIDRDPEAFAVVLHFMRSGEWVAPPGLEHVRVLKEAEFYGVRVPACDFTIPWLRQRHQRRQWEGCSCSVSELSDFVRGEFERLLGEGQPLIVAVLPGFASMQEELAEVRIRTGPDTSERIDLDKLQVASTTSEGVHCVLDDKLYDQLSSVPHEALLDHMRSSMQYTVHIETGHVYFPYSSTLRRCEDDVVAFASPHAPVYSKLHGTLNISRTLPTHDDEAATSRVSGTAEEGHDNSGDRFANLHTRYFPVCEARYVSWDGDRHRLLNSAWRRDAHSAQRAASNVAESQAAQDAKEPSEGPSSADSQG